MSIDRLADLRDLGPKLVIVQGEPTDAALHFAGAPAALGAAVYGGVSLSSLEADGAITVAGDRQLGERFRTLFPMPTKLPLVKA